MVEEGLHVDADLFVVTVDACPVRGFASHAGAAHRGEDRSDDLVAEGEQGGDGACGECPNVITAGPCGFVEQLFAADLAQVVGRLEL